MLIYISLGGVWNTLLLRRTLSTLSLPTAKPLFAPSPSPPSHLLPQLSFIRNHQQPGLQNIRTSECGLVDPFSPSASFITLAPSYLYPRSITSPPSFYRKLFIHMHQQPRLQVTLIKSPEKRLSFLQCRPLFNTHRCHRRPLHTVTATFPFKFTNKPRLYFEFHSYNKAEMRSTRFFDLALALALAPPPLTRCCPCRPLHRYRNFFRQGFTNSLDFKILKKHPKEDKSGATSPSRPFHKLCCSTPTTH